MRHCQVKNMDKIATIIAEARVAKKEYDRQYAKMWAGGHYNGRYQKKATSLYKAWKKIEDQLLKEIYRA